MEMEEVSQVTGRTRLILIAPGNSDLDVLLNTEPLLLGEMPLGPENL